MKYSTFNMVFVHFAHLILIMGKMRHFKDRIILKVGHFEEKQVIRFKTEKKPKLKLFELKAFQEKSKYLPWTSRKIVIRTIRVFVSAQTKIDFVIMEDFLKSNLDSIECSISMECILSQTSTFMITIATIHWSVTHCDNPWSNLTILVCLFQISFDEFDFSGIIRVW